MRSLETELVDNPEIKDLYLNTRQPLKCEICSSEDIFLIRLDKGYCVIHTYFGSTDITREINRSPK